MNVNYWQYFIELSNLPYFSQILNLLNVILILVTAVVSLLSWKAASRANEIQLLPLLSIYFRGKALRDRTIRIRNIGKSPAYDIKIESFVNIVQDIHKVWKLDLAVGGTNVLIPEEERDLTMVATSNGEDVNMAEFMVFHLDPEEEHDRKRIELIMTFRNAEGNKYYSKMETGRGGLYVKTAKRMNYWGLLYVNYCWCREKLLLNWYHFLWKFTKPSIKSSKKLII